MHDGWKYVDDVPHLPATLQVLATTAGVQGALYIPPLMIRDVIAQIIAEELAR